MTTEVLALFDLDHTLLTLDSGQAQRYTFRFLTTDLLFQQADDAAPINRRQRKLAARL